MGDKTDDDKDRWVDEAVARSSTDARYTWQDQVWKPGNTVFVSSGVRPPMFVLAFRDERDGSIIERQAGNSTLWRAVSEDGLSVSSNLSWVDVLSGATTLTVVRVANEDPHPLHEQPMADSPAAVAQAEEPLPFTPFSRPAKRPAEPEVGTVLGFEVQFEADGTRYSYAAIRATSAAKGWYLSGPRYAAQPLTWDQLLDFIGEPQDWARVGVVESWVTLGDL